MLGLDDEAADEGALYVPCESFQIVRRTVKASTEELPLIERKRRQCRSRDDDRSRPRSVSDNDRGHHGWVSLSSFVQYGLYADRDTWAGSANS